MTPKQWISGIVQNLYTVLEGVFAKKTDIKTINSTSLLGSGNLDLVPKSGGAMADGAELKFEDSESTYTTSISPGSIVMTDPDDGFTLDLDASGPGLILNNSTGYFDTGINIGTGTSAKFIRFPSSAGTFALTSQIGKLNTNNASAQSVSSSESFSSTIKLHKVSKTGNYYDLLNRPTIPLVRLETGDQAEDWRDFDGRAFSGMYYDIEEALGDGVLPYIDITFGQGSGQERHEYYYLYSVDSNMFVFIESSLGFTLTIYDDDSFATQGSGIQRTSNLVTSISSSSTNWQYPSAKLLYDELANKQDALVSGTSIKTINNTSVLGSGNFELLPLSGGTTTGPIVIGEMDGQLISTAQTTIDHEYVRIDNGLFGSNLRKAELNSDKIKYSVSSDTYDLAFPATSGTIALTSDIPSVSGKEDTTNKVTSLSSSSTDTQYPSAKCVYDLLGDVETLINAL